MNKNVPKKILPYALIASMLLSGCGEKSDCDVPTEHVHKYVKQITDDIDIEKFLQDESLAVWGGYKWTGEYIEITKNDKKIYDLLKRNGLIEGKVNWDYLYNKMETNHDFLEFYYEYTVMETHITVDDDGDMTTETVPVTYEGWTKDPNNSDNTGLVRLYHHKYYGYKIVYEKNNYKLVKSNAVDDIRNIIEEYPYFKEDCETLDYETFRFSRRELSSLKPEQFDVFEQPNLESSDINPGKVLTK